MLEYGKRYFTKEGTVVRIVGSRNTGDYVNSHVLGDDGIWRHNLLDKPGKVTGLEFSWYNKDDIIPIAIKNNAKITFCKCCGKANHRAMNFWLPMYLCMNNKCNAVSGFWSFVLRFVKADSCFLIYKGSYLETLFEYITEK